VIGESQNFARSLVNEPGNKLTPTILGQRASQMASETGLKSEVWSTDKLQELKMGAFWSVSQGSEQPPALIVLRYEPEGVTGGPVLGLVGKGITFDTGGISIKPSENMEKMKYDMAGGAAMIGAMRAIALLKPRIRVLAVVCAAENMPDGKAQKPGELHPKDTILFTDIILRSRFTPLRWDGMQGQRMIVYAFEPKAPVQSGGELGGRLAGI